MTISVLNSIIFFTSIFHLLLPPISVVMGSSSPGNCGPIEADDRDRIQFALNLEFLEAEFFLYGALGKGLDDIAPYLTQGGPPPIGARRANLDILTRRIIEEFGYQEVGHLRAIINTVGGFPRPSLDLRAENFAETFNRAVGYKLSPPFDPYLNAVNYLLASYVIPYVGLVGYVGTIPNLYNYTNKRLVAGLLGVESGQDAVIRALLYERGAEKVVPYNITVADMTDRISKLRNQLAMCGIKDEGLIVPLELGAENRTTSNILSADSYSLSYSRTPPEILRIVYGSGDERKPGGFYPKGGNGRIAREFLHKP
ncbi:desiccation-related protein PCC13-62 [Tripterygium wilfordii]|uniref:Desiccation-related protein PCC13-62 n=1 Tax=Tripterygium wilfordii TaxID=458696 RepID=A0A7J7CCJ7_TRIWF|nr:desiccation-related protein PCC13-62 [Tripterygium wilfordii]XP_038684035.1 desiccation-related protein PCC13-62 [Tripterygium wilfordii]KAF5731456.1 desiccation-related protein PCC13-62 [Tripterygium wilfordii]